MYARRHPPSIPHYFMVFSFVFYFLVARGFENFFPFTVLDMYATKSSSTSVSHVMALDAQDQAQEVRRFGEWRCDTVIAPNQGLCQEHGTFDRISYKDRDNLDYVFHKNYSSTPSAGEPVKLIRRIWRLDDRAGPPPFEDCVLTSCRAVRR